MSEKRIHGTTYISDLETREQWLKDQSTARDLLHDIAFFSHRIDNRLTPDYENGWNDGVDAVVKKALAWFAAQGINADNYEYTYEEENAPL